MFLAKFDGIFTGAGCKILGKFQVEVALLVCSLFGPSSQSGHNVASSILAASSTICKGFGRVGGIRQAHSLLLQDFGVATRISYSLNSLQGSCRVS